MGWEGLRYLLIHYIVVLLHYMQYNVMIESFLRENVQQKEKGI